MATDVCWFAGARSFIITEHFSKNPFYWPKFCNSFGTTCQSCNLAASPVWKHMPQDARFWESIGKSAECPLDSTKCGAWDRFWNGWQFFWNGLHSRQPMFLVSGNKSPERKKCGFPVLFKVCLSQVIDRHASGQEQVDSIFHHNFACYKMLQFDLVDSHYQLCF